LNAPEPSGAENGVDAADEVNSPDEVATMPQPQTGMARPGGYMTEQQQQALYYQQIQQQQQAGGQYAGMPQMPAHQQRS
jgi:pheromone receptor transcription factor